MDEHVENSSICESVSFLSRNPLTSLRLCPEENILSLSDLMITTLIESSLSIELICF